jgi:molybdopterin/thiamine biosynthesis adenylyltransferase
MPETLKDRINYRAEFDEPAYWERVSRNQAWLGTSEEEARRNQLRLRDATIGIAGVGGIGGAVAMRLVRMGAGHLKLADPESFDMSNIQRQSGARLDTLGRNKAEVVAEQTYELTRDVDIEVFTDGIHAGNAEEFVEGCDLIADQIEFFELDARYALQRAARASDRCGLIISVATVGHGALVVKYDANSISSEDAWGLDAGSSKEEMAKAFMEKLLPDELISSFPGREALTEWLVKRGVAPIWGATPALCEGVLVDQICAHVIGFPGMKELPVQPGWAWMDMFSWRAGVREE